MGAPNASSVTRGAARERWVRGLAGDLEKVRVGVVLDRKDDSRLGTNVARFLSRIAESDFAVVGTSFLIAQERY